MAEHPAVDDNFIESICTRMQSPERTVRQRALIQFEEQFLVAKLPEEYPAVFDAAYLHLLRCYTDRFESVRCLAIGAMGVLLEKLPVSDYYLGYVVPVMAKRIGQAELIEESEEIRLQLLEQLEQLIERHGDPNGSRGDPLLKTYDDIVDILVKTLRDPFPAAQKKSCEMVKLLAGATPSFHYRAEALVEPATAVLKHRHSANRIAAIEALGVLALHILSNADCVTKIIVDISPLLMDGVPFVRLACGRVGCQMLLQLRDRYSLFHRILPLVLNCLTDDTAEVREDIAVRWKEAGELYYRENETELSKMALIDRLPDGYPTERYNRPTIPCRAIVQRSLRVVSLVLHEMEEWKEDIRLHATKLLKQIVLHAEKNLSTQFMEVYQVLARACMDTDRAVMGEALSVCELLGILLEYCAWSRHVVAEFLKNPTIGHLRSMRVLYAKAAKERSEDLRLFVQMLDDAEICHNLKESYQEELLAFCEVLVDDYVTLGLAGGMTDLSIEEQQNETLEGLRSKVRQFVSDITNDEGQHEPVERLLYSVVLQVVALCPEERCAVKGKGLDILRKLDANVGNLHCMHLGYVLRNLEHLEHENTDTAVSIMLLSGMVTVCGFQGPYLRTLQTILETALRHAAPQGRVKLFSAISSAMLKWSETIAVVQDEQIALLKSFIEAIISPYLIWSTGKSAESVRSMASACFAALAQGVDPLTFPVLLPAYLSVLAGLIDDNSIATRAYTLRTLLRMGPLDLDGLKLIAFPILSRLDDPCGEVRELAAQCLGRLKLQCTGEPAEQEETTARWYEMLKQIMKSMFLHLENPETRLQKAIFASLKRQYIDHRELIKGLANEVPQGCPYKKDLDTITV